MFDVVGIEMPCVDMAVNLDRFPEPNGGELVREMSWQGGGKVSTGMVAAARLGVKGAMIGAAGTDAYGKFCKEDFERHGIDTEKFYLREGKTTGLSIVLSNRETMGRSIVYRMGTAETVEDKEVPGEYLKNTKYFFVAMLDDVIRKAAKTAKEAGAKIFIDADMYSDELVEFIPEVDVFVASEFVYEAMFDNDSYEENCRKVMEMGPEIVVFTFGEKGCVGLSKEGFFKLPSFQVDVVDTVGAGDVFHGAFLAGLIRGMSVKDTARMASAVSAIKCTRIGGRAGIPDFETVSRFLEDGKIDYSEIDKRVDFYRKGIG